MQSAVYSYVVSREKFLMMLNPENRGDRITKSKKVLMSASWILSLFCRMGMVVLDQHASLIPVRPRMPVTPILGNLRSLLSCMVVCRLVMCRFSEMMSSLVMKAGRLNCGRLRS